MEWLVPIVVALIGGPLVIVVQRLRKENTDQHAESREILNIVVTNLDKVDKKLDNHIDWHLKIPKRKGK